MMPPPDPRRLAQRDALARRQARDAEIMAQHRDELDAEDRRFADLCEEARRGGRQSPSQTDHAANRAGIIARREEAIRQSAVLHDAECADALDRQNHPAVE